jgi:hypothetical protein
MANKARPKREFSMTSETTTPPISRHTAISV